MSQARFYEPNAGPLKLEHDLSFSPVHADATPRDFKFNPVVGSPSVVYQTDFRYKGYPGHSFLSPRIPVIYSLEAAKRAEQKYADHYGKQSLFDPVKPRLYEGNRGVQYGSRHLHTPPPVPKRTYIPPSVRAVPFGENKTQEEIEKRMFLQKEVEQDIQRYKEEQAQKKQREMEEKRKDLERLKNNFMLDAHKYGHGASKGDGDHKRRKFQEEELTPRENPRYRDPKYRELTHPVDLAGEETKHPDFFLSELSKERAVEQPSHTDHTLRGDGIIRFQEEGRKSIENRFRYNKPQQEKEELRRDLDRQQIERQHREHAEKLRDLRQEVELLKSSDHYGKPGAGAPNKSSSEYFEANKKDVELKSLELERTRGGAGAPVLDTDGKTLTRFPITMKRDNMGVATMRDQVATMKRSQVYEPEEALYSPFGRPGCGAPMKDTEGRIVAVRQGKLRDTGSAEEIRKKRAALSYRRDLQHEMEEQKRNREDMENYMKAPIGELTEIMKEGLVGRPRRDPITGTLLNQHLANSDISKLKMNKSEVKPVNSMKEYHDFLTHQALERERTKRLDKLRDNQEWKHHHDVFGSMFGKRGGGAPKGDNLKKERLDNTLFSPRRDHKAFVGDQNEEYSSSKLGQRFVKSTIPSKHSNMYEIPEKGPSNPYSTRAPYAIHNY
ncbi:apical junction molecule-like isoform X2 [Haliotis asinina]|uniref:apical junction molecule-like isoform X2 n=1 Tax=Haliotis asinina TaxID=109174 RepID=UPI003531DF99